MLTQTIFVLPSASQAQAAERARFRLLYSAPSGCPDGAEFSDFLAARLGYSAVDPNATARALIEIREEGTTLQASLRYENSGQDPIERTLQANRGECVELDRSLSFVLALILDPLASSPEPQNTIPSPDPNLAPPTNPSSDYSGYRDSTRERRQSETIVPFGRLLPPQTASRSEEPPPEPRNYQVAALTLALGFNLGITEAAAFASDLALWLRPSENVALEFRAIYVPSQGQILSPTTSASVQSLGGAFNICGVVDWFSMCIGPGIHAWIYDYNSSTALSSASPSVPLNLGARIRFVELGSLSLGANVQGSLNLLRGKIEARTSSTDPLQTIYQQPLAGFDLRLEANIGF